MRILFACGGSIGHIAPCVAVWRALPECSASFICSSRGEDEEFLKKENASVDVLPMRGVSLANIVPMTLRARRILKRRIPDAVFTKGGGVTIPVALAARWLRVPIVVHESDAIPGRSTRLISRWAAAVCGGFPGFGTFTGNPVRAEVTNGSRDAGLRLTGFSGTRPVLLVVGGSQGSLALNDAIIKNIDGLTAIADVAHVTGKGKRGASARPGYWSREFVQEELPHLYAIAGLALSRAGAGSIGELAANSIPAILVPLTGVAHDHQAMNARAAEAAGGCIVLPQERLPAELTNAVSTLLADDGKRAAMGDKFHTLSRPDAANALAKITFDVAANARA